MENFSENCVIIYSMKTIDLNSKPVKYLLNQKKGLNKKESALKAGYADGSHITQIEKSQDYVAARIYFKDELLSKISLGTLAGELLKNIEQDTDRGAKNAAIKIALDKLEPDEIHSDQNDKVLVILKG